MGVNLSVKSAHVPALMMETVVKRSLIGAKTLRFDSSALSTRCAGLVHLFRRTKVDNHYGDPDMTWWTSTLAFTVDAETGLCQEETSHRSRNP